MCVNEVGVARGSARSPRERRHEGRQNGSPRRLRTKVPDDSGSVGDAEVAEGRRRDDLHVDSCGTDVRHGVRDEPSCGIPGEAGVRSREDNDSHVRRSRRPKTIGTQSASMTNA